MRSISTMIVDDGGVGVATSTGEDTKPVMNYYNDGQEEEDDDQEQQENDLVIDDGQQQHFAAGTGNSSGNDTDSETYSTVSGAGGAFSLAALNGGRRKQHKPIRYPTLTQPFFFEIILVLNHSSFGIFWLI